MKSPRSVIFFVVSIACLAVSARSAELPWLAESERRPQLQFVNGSNAPIDIFWLKSDTERVPNCSVAPGKNVTISTTIGHRFVVTGHAPESEATVTSEVPMQSFRVGGVPAFYTQHADAHGFPIVASPKVNPYALKEATYLVDLMLAQRPDVRTALSKCGARLCIMAHDEYTSDLPDFPWFAENPHPDFPDFSGRDYWDARARGTGPSDDQVLTTCAEENVLGFPGDPYAAECILIHEFAHCIHLRGMANVDRTFDARLQATYQAAMKAGLWKATYASTNHREYFAEGVQSWFDNNRANDNQHNDIDTRAKLLTYDPGLAALCREVFGDTEIKYTKPATRLTGHLKGYDPTTAPTFVWPARLLAVRKVIDARIEARNKAVRAVSEAEQKSAPQNADVP